MIDKVRRRRFFARRERTASCKPARNSAGALLSLTALCVPSGPALAAGGEDALDVIIVTAQRRAEDQQAAPIAISSISGEALAARRIRTIEDLGAYAPGLTTTNTVSYGAAPLSIRGIGGANGGGNFFNDEPVAVYVDGVYVARLSMSTADLLDIESIQILRGPQGTLYGRNSTAGAVLITSNAPAEEVSGQLRASIARFGDYHAQGYLTGALGENISARAAIGYSKRDGYGTNIVNDGRVGGGEDFTARTSIRYQPHADLSLDLIGEYQDRSASPALIAMTDVGNTGVASPFVLRSDLRRVLDEREFELDDVNSTTSETMLFTAITNWDLGGVSLGMITAVRDWSLLGEQDSDSTGLQLFTNRGAIDSRQYSHEMRLASDYAGPLSWIVGGMYFHDRSDVLFSIQNFQGLFGLGTDATFDANQKTDAHALFADATYEITEELSFTAGGRYSHERKSFENTLVVAILNGGVAPPTFLGGATLAPGTVFSAPPTFTDSASFSDFSPRVIIDYKPQDEILLFASYSQGFKSGGFNSFGLTPAFDAERVHAYELGVKTEFADRRYRINAAAFAYDYSDLQIRLPVPTGGVNIQNVAQASIKGIELEGAAVAGKGFTISASVSLLDTEIVEGAIPAISSTTPPFPIGAPLPLTTEDAAGNRLTRAPEYQGAISAVYERALGNFTGSVSIDYRFQGDVFFLETNQDADTFRGDGWGDLGLRASLASAKGGWELAFFARNLTDNRRVTAVTALGGFPNAALNEPRIWGVESKVRF